MLSFRFFWTARADGERVDGILHQLAERLVNHAVAGNGGLAGEARRDDGEAPVRAAAGTRAGVAGVLRALVHQVEFQRLERGEALADALRDAQGFSSPTCLARNRDCKITNRNISPMPPKSLNEAHTFSE